MPAQAASRAACAEFAIRVPAFAGTSGHRQGVAIDSPLESHVQTGAKHIGIKRDIATRQQAAIEPAVEVAEVDEQILALDAHIRDDAELETAAHGPSGIGDAAAGKSGNAGANVAECQAGGEIRQEAIDRVAEPDARGREPRVAALATGGQSTFVVPLIPDQSMSPSPPITS